MFLTTEALLYRYRNTSKDELYILISLSKGYNRNSLTFGYINTNMNIKLKKPIFTAAAKNLAIVILTMGGNDIIFSIHKTRVTSLNLLTRIPSLTCKLPLQPKIEHLIKIRNM